MLPDQTMKCTLLSDQNIFVSTQCSRILEIKVASFVILNRLTKWNGGIAWWQQILRSIQRKSTQNLQRYGYKQFMSKANPKPPKLWIWTPFSTANQKLSKVQIWILYVKSRSRTPKGKDISSARKFVEIECNLFIWRYQLPYWRIIA